MMIYAIPSKQGKICQHFTKAEQFSFIDENNTLLASVNNSAALPGASCQDKNAIVQQLQSMKADAVIVKNIGERLLGKLLNAGIKVFQVNQVRPREVLSQGPMQELNDPSQGRPSMQQGKKSDCHGKQRCCNNAEHTPHHGQGRAGRHGHSGKRCCH
jgi:predicted Fe-Mo cluster-binding NifX family protein